MRELFFQFPLKSMGRRIVAVILMAVLCVGCGSEEVGPANDSGSASTLLDDNKLESGIPSPDDSGDETMGDEDNHKGVYWSKVDWDSYRMVLSKEDFNELKRYLPYLTGKKKMYFIDSYDKTSRKYFFADGASHQREEFDEEDIYVCGFRLVDLCGSGNKDLLLDLEGVGSRGFGLHLHMDGDELYSEDYDERWFLGVWENGVYNRGYDGKKYCRMTFAEGFFEEEILACKRDGMYEDGHGEITEADFVKWVKENCKTKIKWFPTRKEADIYAS